MYNDWILVAAVLSVGKSWIHKFFMGLAILMWISSIVRPI